MYNTQQFERFLQPGRFCGASVYGPATFQPAPVFLFKETIDDATGAVTATTLVASGTLLSVNPDHIILKKIVLTGYPISVPFSTAFVFVGRLLLVYVVRVSSSINSKAIAIAHYICSCDTTYSYAIFASLSARCIAQTLYTSSTNSHALLTRINLTITECKFTVTRFSGGNGFSSYVFINGFHRCADAHRALREMQFACAVLLLWFTLVQAANKRKKAIAKVDAETLPLAVARISDLFLMVYMSSNAAALRGREPCCRKTVLNEFAEAANYLGSLRKPIVLAQYEIKTLSDEVKAEEHLPLFSTLKFAPGHPALIHARGVKSTCEWPQHHVYTGLQHSQRAKQAPQFLRDHPRCKVCTIAADSLHTFKIVQAIVDWVIRRSGPVVTELDSESVLTEFASRIGPVVVGHMHDLSPNR
eukprot:8496-Heterococcus_DN1.PRE.1